MAFVCLSEFRNYEYYVPVHSTQVYVEQETNGTRKDNKNIHELLYNALCIGQSFVLTFLLLYI